MKRKTIVAAIFVLGVLLISVISGVGMVSESEYSEHGGEQWRTDFDAARETAESENKPVLLYFWSNDCTYCQQFDSRMKQSKYESTLDKFTLSAVRMQSHPDLSSRYNITGTPELVVVDENGERISTFIPTQTADPKGAMEDAYVEWQNQTTSS